MNTNETKHELDKIREYQKKGYTANYRFENNQLIDSETGEKFSADDITIVEEYRYEGISNPSDMSILYVMKMPDQSKGTILVPYGPTGDSELSCFFKSVSKNKKNQEENSKL